MIKFVIVIFLFISNFNFGMMSENLEKTLKETHIENTIQSESAEAKQVEKIEQNSSNKTAGNANKPVVSTSKNDKESTNKTDSTQKPTQETNTNTETINTPVPEKNTVQIQKCEGNKHGIETGNSGKWFNTQAEAEALFDVELKKWGDKWTNGEIDKDTYMKNCPYGYEDWSCPYCHKWTINFYYR